MPARSAVVVLLLCGVALAAEPGWENSLPTALAKAKQAGKQVFVDVAADWCGPCQKLAAGFRDPQVTAALKGFVAVRVDADRDAAVASKYKVSGLPTLLVLSADGRELARCSGYRSPAELAAWLSAAAPKSKPPAGDELGRRLDAIHKELAGRL